MASHGGLRMSSRTPVFRRLGGHRSFGIACSMKKPPWRNDWNKRGRCWSRNFRRMRSPVRQAGIVDKLEIRGTPGKTRRDHPRGPLSRWLRGLSGSRSEQRHRAVSHHPVPDAARRDFGRHSVESVGTDACNCAGHWIRWGRLLERSTIARSSSKRFRARTRAIRRRWTVHSSGQRHANSPPSGLGISRAR